MAGEREPLFFPRYAEDCRGILEMVGAGETFSPEAPYGCFRRPDNMFIMPDFIYNNEEWIIWLMNEEFNGRATLRMISERMHIPPDQAAGHIERLEQGKAVSVVRDPETKMNIISIGLTPAGKSLHARMKER
jgi:hypothetical protein